MKSETLAAPKAKRARVIEADKLFNRPWGMNEQSFKALVASQMNASAWDDDDEDYRDEKDYPVTDDGIACIPVTGPLTKGYYWRGTSYSEVVAMAKDAYSDPRIKAVLFCYDSPGGEGASAMFEASDLLFQLRDQKPTAAISDDQCYSAAYCLASASPMLFVNRAAGVGSIGCWTAHVDLSEMYKQAGVKVTYIYAGAKKVDGNPTEPLSDRAQADMQEGCDRLRDMFVQTVARNRSVSADELYATEAGCYDAEKGLPLLADQVGSKEDALAYLRGRMSAKDDSNDASAGGGLDASNIRGEGAKTAAELEAEVFLASSAYSQMEGAPKDIQSLFRIAARGAARGAGWVEAETTPAGEVRLAVRTAINRASVSNDGRLIKCCVAPYNQLSADLGGFKEIYAPGCFKESIEAGDDARALFNHDSNFILGRRSAGTVRFYEEADGLYFDADAPETNWANDLLVSMRRKDITGGSAAFFILQPRWEYRDGGKVRVIEKARLVEASIASFPIYETTQASVSPAVAAEMADPAIAASAADAALETSNDLDKARLDLLRLRN